MGLPDVLDKEGGGVELVGVEGEGGLEGGCAEDHELLGAVGGAVDGGRRGGLMAEGGDVLGGGGQVDEADLLDGQGVEE